jgi:CxxC motif-containing protein (DUF1111 family)
MRARAILTGAIIAQGCLFASAVVVTQGQEPLAPSEVTREAPAALTAAAVLAPPTEAPAGFDLLTNGAVDTARFEAALVEFTGPEEADEGLGPVFNAAGCAECHATPIIGGSSQVVERRAGRFDGQNFIEHPGGSLIQDRSLFPGLQERVLPGNNVLAFRASLSILGLGFVEAIDSNTIAAIAQSQSSSIRGQLIQVPVLEAGGATRVGRFGWKNQQASLLSFSADAYSNEMGISTPLLPLEQLSNGQALPAGTDPFPGEPGVTDDTTNDDIQLFADFMRSTKVPPRDTAIAASQDSRRGESLFASVGCASCHTPTIVTAPAGTNINGGTFRVPAALGNKMIHPFSDFLLHDIGTGDGIVQNGGPQTRNKLRTVPLWGLRARGRFMHDAASQSFGDAIARHGGQASGARAGYNALSSADRNRVLLFLSSL